MAVKTNKYFGFDWLSFLDGFAGNVVDNIGGVWSDDVDAGHGPTGMDIFQWAYDEYSRNQQNQWQENMYREDRAWQEDMYERYQTIPAQVRQMQEAGLNPALMYGQGAGSPSAVSSGQMPSSGSGSSPTDGRGVLPNRGIQTLSAVMSAIVGILGQGVSVGNGISQMTRNKHQNDKDDAQSDLFDSERTLNAERERGLKLENDMTEIKRDVYDVMIGLQMDKTRSEIAKNASEYWRNNSESWVNASLIELNQAKTTNEQLKAGTEILTWCQKSLDIQKAQALLPWTAKLAEAEYNLKVAQEKVSDSQVGVNEAQAALIQAQADFEQALIDAGAPEQEVKNMEAERKQGWWRVISGCITDFVWAGLGIFDAAKGGKSPGSRGTRSRVTTLYGPDGKTPMSVDYSNMNIL